jgi:hypothetical protein
MVLNDKIAEAEAISLEWSERFLGAFFEDHAEENPSRNKCRLGSAFRINPP